MRLLVGPRALQCLVTLVMKNSKAKKIHNSKTNEAIKDFIMDYAKQNGD